MTYLTEMRDAIDRRQGWQFDRDMADTDPERAPQYRANELRAEDDARLMALASIAESLADIANALRDDDDNNPVHILHNMSYQLATIARNTRAIDEAAQ